MFQFNATFLIAMFSFVVFILIMNAIFYRPILGIIRKREEYISNNYEEADRLENSAKEITTTCDAKIAQTQEKCRHEFRSAVTEVQDGATETIKEAREKSKLAIQEKKEDLSYREDELKKTIKSCVVGELASSIASKILGQDTTVENLDNELINKGID